jgi:hypothetical protein
MLFHARARIPDLPRRRQVDPPEAPGSRSPCGSRDRIYEPYAGALAGYLQRRRTSSRCQRNSVAGWTRNEYCLARGRTWVSAASTARSAARRRGRAICRLSTCNSWRRRRISISSPGPNSQPGRAARTSGGPPPVDEGQALKQQTLSSHLPTERAAAKDTELHLTPSATETPHLRQTSFWDPQASATSVTGSVFAKCSHSKDASASDGRLDEQKCRG